MFAEHVPDSGQDHAANGNNGFLMASASLDTAVTDAEFRVILGFNDSIGDLNKGGFKAGAGSGDAGRFDFNITLVISGAATRPGDEILGRRENGHIDADFGDDSDSGHRILIETGDGMNQVEGGLERGDEAVDFSDDLRTMVFKLIDVVETLTKLDGLFVRNGAVDSGLNFRDRSFAASIDER